MITKLEGGGGDLVVGPQFFFFLRFPNVYLIILSV